MNRTQEVINRISHTLPLTTIAGMRSEGRHSDVYVFEAVQTGLNEYVKGKLKRIEPATDYSRLKRFN